MKRLNLLLFSFFISIMISCTGTSNTDNVKKEDVLGYWKLSKESYNNFLKKGLETKNEIVTEFHLNADLTAVVSFGNSIEGRGKVGKWSWKVEEKLGSNDFVNLNFDILITSQKTENSIYKLGLLLNKKDGKINLIGNNEYVKQ
jgi:hypothetical protein